MQNKSITHLIHYLEPGVNKTNSTILCYVSNMLGSTHPPVKYVLALFSGGKVHGVLHRPTTTILTPSLRMSRAIELLPSVPVWLVTGRPLPLNI